MKQTNQQQRQLRVRGLVQGVGFRPTVWLIASDMQLKGNVLNDGSGVLINLCGDINVLDAFEQRLLNECPPLARIDSIERVPLSVEIVCEDFHIVKSDNSEMHTGVVADAATCQACLEDINDPSNCRFGYAFTNCTHCGPRFSIIKSIPYDRANTSMKAFPMCNDCSEEYQNPADRRFHAQPNACLVCGPQVWATDNQGNQIECKDAIALVAEAINQGSVVAIKGIGGFHLACDAENKEAIATLRQRKRRPHKPLALMAADIEQIENYCRVNQAETEVLKSPAAPIVVLNAKDAGLLPNGIAPGQTQWGFMLPYSPVHHLLMQKLQRPIVLTSGNLTEEPQCTDNQDALDRLSKIADVFLLHDRDIVNRIDDSVTRYSNGQVRIMRRARGYAPSQIVLPMGFEKADGLLAMGAELKNTFCMLKDGQAILSQHMGDLEDARTFDDYCHNIDLYRHLYAFEPIQLAVDIHPEYRSTKYGLAWAEREQLGVQHVQHHHAHVASCMADNGLPLDHPKILGITLDGLGMGEDNALWGGEVLLADYHEYRRLARLKPVALPGAAKAMHEPWRNTYAQLQACNLWQFLQNEHSELELLQQLQQQPLETLDIMLQRKLNSPLSSSAGRLFDAVAGALGLCATSISYEGQAAMALEALVSDALLAEESVYEFAVDKTDDLLQIDPEMLWQQLIKDLSEGTDAAVMATRFHKGLATALSTVTAQLAKQHQITKVALSGGVFQNKTLHQLVHQQLQQYGLQVLSHQQIPANDGGIALGQALIAAANTIKLKYSADSQA